MPGVGPIELLQRSTEVFPLAGWLSNVKERVRSLRKARPRAAWRLSHDSSGLKVEPPAHENPPVHSSLPWNQVVAVRAFKKDMVSVDLICLQFETADGRRCLVHEEMVGWESLVEELPDYLPGFPLYSTWWSRVAKPAFAANEQVLYERTKS